MFFKHEICGFKVISSCAFVLLLLLSCGGGSQDRKSVAAVTAVPKKQENGILSIPVAFNKGGQLGLLGPEDPSKKNVDFSLADSVTSWSISIAGCASGYAKSFTSGTDTTVKMLKDDTGCYARLTSVTIDAIVYDFDSTGGTATDVAADWQPFSTSANYRYYKDATNATIFRKLKVKINTTITLAGITTGDTISYTYFGLDPESGSLTVRSATVSISGQDANLFNLRAAKLASVDGVKGIFAIGLECNSVVATTSCQGIDITGNSSQNFGYRLVKGQAVAQATAATSGELSTTATELTFSDIQTAFDYGPAPTFLTSATNWVAAAGSVAGTTLTNGGIKIVTAGSGTGGNTSDSIIDITASGGYMFLIIGMDTDATAGIDAYQYWKISVN